MADEPTHWELSRRLDAQDKRLEQGLAAIASRLDELPSEKTLLALLATERAHTQAIADDVKDLRQDLAKEEAARVSAFAALEARAVAARNFAIGSIGLTVTVLFGVIGFVNRLGGAG